MTFTDPELILNSIGNSDSTYETPQLNVRSFGMTDRGLVRDSNEDQFLIAELTKALRIQGSSLPEAKTRYANDNGHIFLVADGIGGSPAGEQASALAVKSIEEFLVNTLKWFYQLKGPEKENVVSEFQDALRQADARIFAEVAQHPEFGGMGTTLTLAYSLGANLFVANAGDSRCYLFRDSELVQLTNDHTLAQHMIGRDSVPLVHPDRRLLLHVITNAIGGRTPGVRVEVHKATLVSDDVLLLATDGLTRYVPHERIAAALEAEPDPKTACERLVGQALEQGGRDNVTVIVARYETLAV
jgi:serine/threonine protein phosphatase PrpC